MRDPLLDLKSILDFVFMVVFIQLLFTFFVVLFLWIYKYINFFLKFFFLFLFQWLQTHAHRHSIEINRCLQTIFQYTYASFMCFFSASVVVLLLFLFFYNEFWNKSIKQHMFIQLNRVNIFTLKKKNKKMNFNRNSVLNYCQQLTNAIYACLFEIFVLFF